MTAMTAGIISFLVALAIGYVLTDRMWTHEYRALIDKRIKSMHDEQFWQTKCGRLEQEMRDLRAMLEKNGVLNFEYHEIYDDNGEFVKKIRKDAWIFENQEKTK